MAVSKPSIVSVETGPSRNLEPADLASLRTAFERLEHESYTARLTNMVGKQIELATALIPEKVRSVAENATGMALKAAMKVALRSLDPAKPPRASSAGLHKSLATASGAAGGALGLAALPFELTVSTTLILRSIADIARAEGEDINDPQTALACMEVFAMGGRTEVDDHLRSSYFAVRALLAKSITEASKYMLHRKVADETAPVVVKLIAQIAARFGVAVSQKAVAQAVPILGAIGGAAVNYAFIEHFQSIARGHFAVRRLERIYGEDFIRIEYERLKTEDDDRAAKAKVI